MMIGNGSAKFLFQDIEKVDQKDYPVKAIIYERIYNVAKCLEAVIILRLLRLSVYLDEIKTFRIIMETLKSLISPFWSVLCVMFSIFYIYALIGMSLWSGEIDFSKEEIRGNDATPDNWALNNFNDLANSYLVLFELVVVNNWMITTAMYVEVSKTRWVLVYFVSFYIIAVLIGMNILVCFAIDMYASIRRLDNEQAAHE